ncbi:MAG: hypothetical protein HXY20_14470 [Acidobacteria bacterium]|nr:hypothetical protein [Acidobacteriota bacterium]
MFHTSAGERNEALDRLEKGLEIHDPALPYLGYSLFDDLRPHPRFQDLLREMRLPEGDKKREGGRS